MKQEKDANIFVVVVRAKNKLKHEKGKNKFDLCPLKLKVVKERQLSKVRLRVHGV